MISDLNATTNKIDVVDVVAWARSAISSARKETSILPPKKSP
jgi:hypothetical protein